MDTSGLSLFSLTGQTALVTGGARGLGLAIARGLGEAGARVVIGGRDAAALDGAVVRLKDVGVDASKVVLDVRDRDAVDRAVTTVETTHGGIHVLVNNAGIQQRQAFDTFDDDDWQRIVDTNLGGAFRMARRVGPSMIARGAGKIINICSLMSELGRPTIVPYTAAKGGLKMLTKGLAVEWARHNVQVNGIGPGYFATDMNRALMEDEDFDAFVRQRTPMGRWGDPNELVGTAVFLASAASDFVTGQVIYVDGGVLAAL